MGEVQYLYIHKLRETYAAIASKIDELVEHLNVLEHSDVDEVRALAVRISTFLDRLNYSIMHELKEGKSLGHALGEFKGSLLDELAAIRKLKESIAIAPTHPTAEVITKIHALTIALAEDFKKQEMQARKAA